MKIERTDKEILIRISNSIDKESVQRIIDYIHYQELTSKSKAKQEDVDKLAAEVNKDWWKKIKIPFLISAFSALFPLRSLRETGILQSSKNLSPLFQPIPFQQ